MLIRKITEKDIPAVSIIHHKYLKLGVLSHLGADFLQKFYKTLITQEQVFTFVAVNKGKVIGFATGAINLKSVPKLMLSKLWFPTAVAIFKNPSLIIKVLQMPFYPSFKTAKNIGEIFSIAVVPKYRRQKVGTSLIENCAREFKKRRCKYFQVSVRAKMKNANDFYVKSKFKKKTTAKFLQEEIVFYQKKI